MRPLLAALVVAAASTPTLAQQTALSDRSVVFSLDSDSLPFVLYTSKTGAVFLALGFAGDEARCGWKGRFGIVATANGQRPSSARADGPGCSLSVAGTSSTTVNGGQMQLTWQGTGTVTGQQGGGILSSNAGAGPFPLAMLMTATVQGSTCSVSGGSQINGRSYRWGVTSCRVEQGNALR